MSGQSHPCWVSVNLHTDIASNGFWIVGWFSYILHGYVVTVSRFFTTFCWFLLSSVPRWRSHWRLRSRLNVKVKLCLCFNWTPRHEDVLREWRYSSTHSFTSALDGCEWSASRSSRFTPRERAPRTHWIEGWVGPRTVLDAVVKRKIPSSRRKSNPRTPIVQPVAQRYTDWAIPGLQVKCSCRFWTS
jgi:hypothetical protein